MLAQANGEDLQPSGDVRRILGCPFGKWVIIYFINGMYIGVSTDLLTILVTSWDIQENVVLFFVILKTEQRGCSLYVNYIYQCDFERNLMDTW